MLVPALDSRCYHPFRWSVCRPLERQGQYWAAGCSTPVHRRDPTDSFQLTRSGTPGSFGNGACGSVWYQYATL